MRILHVADRLSDRGGAYAWMLGVVEGLAEADLEQRLVVGEDEGVLRTPCPVEVCAGLEARVATAVDLRPLVADFAPDVIHLHNVVNPSVLEWAAPLGSALLTVQDHRFFCPTRGKWTRAGGVCSQPMASSTCAPCFEDAAHFRAVLTLTERRLAAARRMSLTVLSHYMRDELLALGAPPSRVHVVPPFVQGLDLGAAPAGPPCVLFVGRLVEAKGVRDAVEAWRRSAVDLPLVVAGTGPLRGEIAARAARCESPLLEILGWVERDRLGGVYRRGRALLLPSRWQEPFGIVGLEALAFGVPVVAWESGGVREWHPGPGLLAWGDVLGMARALEEAVTRRAAPARGFDRGEAVRRLLALYREKAARAVS